MKKQIKKGNTVVSMDDHIKGIVQIVTDKTVTIFDEDGFERVYPINRIIVYDDTLDQAKVIPKVKDKSVKKQRNTPKEFPVIDLHNTSRYLAKNEILPNQIRIFKMELNSAIGKSFERIIFIHGSGNGVLRKEIDRILKRHNIQFGDAPYHTYGQGAIEIYLPKKHKRIV